MNHANALGVPKENRIAHAIYAFWQQTTSHRRTKKIERIERLFEDRKTALDNLTLESMSANLVVRSVTDLNKLIRKREEFEAAKRKYGNNIPRVTLRGFYQSVKAYTLI